MIPKCTFNHPPTCYILYEEKLLQQNIFNAAVIGFAYRHFFFSINLQALLVFVCSQETIIQTCFKQQGIVGIKMAAATLLFITNILLVSVHQTLVKLIQFTFKTGSQSIFENKVSWGEKIG